MTRTAALASPENDFFTGGIFQVGLSTTPISCGGHSLIEDFPMRFSPRFLRRLSDILFIGGLLTFFVYGLTGMAMAAEPTNPATQYQAEFGERDIRIPGYGRWED